MSPSRDAVRIEYLELLDRKYLDDAYRYWHPRELSADPHPLELSHPPNNMPRDSFADRYQQAQIDGAIHYLVQKRLVEVEDAGDPARRTAARITAQGIDFLANAGSFTADRELGSLAYAAITIQHNITNVVDSAVGLLMSGGSHAFSGSATVVNHPRAVELGAQFNNLVDAVAASAPLNTDMRDEISQHLQVVLRELAKPLADQNEDTIDRRWKRIEDLVGDHSGLRSMVSSTGSLLRSARSTSPGARKAAVASHSRRAAKSATKSEPETSFGHLLRGYRRAAGLSRQRLAVRVGRSDSYLARVESHELPPSRGLILEISDALGLDLRDRQQLFRVAGLPSTIMRTFLCHSSGDKAKVRDLYRRLSETNKADPWLDTEKLLPGQDWELEIKKAIRGSDVVLICLSTSSVTKRGFVQKEIQFALDEASRQPEGSIFLIPVKLEDCAVPEQLCRYQWVNLFETKGLERLLQAMEMVAETLLNQQKAASAVDSRPEPASTALDSILRVAQQNGHVMTSDEQSDGNVVYRCQDVNCTAAVTYDRLSRIVVNGDSIGNRCPSAKPAARIVHGAEPESGLEEIVRAAQQTYEAVETRQRQRIEAEKSRTDAARDINDHIRELSDQLDGLVDQANLRMSEHPISTNRSPRNGVYVGVPVRTFTYFDTVLTLEFLPLSPPDTYVTFDLLPGVSASRKPKELAKREVMVDSMSILAVGVLKLSRYVREQFGTVAFPRPAEDSHDQGIHLLLLGLPGEGLRKWKTCELHQNPLAVIATLARRRIVLSNARDIIGAVDRRHTMDEFVVDLRDFSDSDFSALLRALVAP